MGVKTLTVEEFRQEVKKQIGSGTQREFGLKHNVSNSYVNDVLRGHRNPSHKLAVSMGFRMITLFEKLSD
jgi:hypothetical protein